MDLKPRNAEIIIGLVARLGVDTRAVVGAIKDELKKYKYEVHESHLTDLLGGFKHKLDLVDQPAEARYKSYIKACNKLREDFDLQEAMAYLAIADIAAHRGSTGSETPTEVRNAYIVNQIKRPEEFELLRSVYGEHYIQVSCHASEEHRISRLTKRIIDDHPEDPKSPNWNLEARSLIATDESQEDDPYGQRVRTVFPLSDVVIDATDKDAIEKHVSRFFRALFGDYSVTPTQEEYGMELANTASQRSSDLSRQVGAAILNENAEVQALGCNEVPKAHGGTYWEGDQPDGREFKLGVDANEVRKNAVLIDLMLRLRDAGGLAPQLHDPQSIKEFLFDREDDKISEAQIMDSLEYGRSVHAEMNAITDAARGGHAIRGCTLYCNTFPCHNCAKHIVASGIETVVYSRPYPKSYAAELFGDSLAIDPDGTDSTKIRFKQFIGISGPMYARVFTKARWKGAGGVVRQFDKATASFIRRTPVPAYPAVEVLLLDEMAKFFIQKGYYDQAVLSEGNSATGA